MEYTVEIIPPDEEGIQFYLELYKPFRLLALQLSPEGKRLSNINCVCGSDQNQKQISNLSPHAVLG